MKNALKNGVKGINIEMDRTEFLKLCQKASVIPKSAGAELKYDIQDVIVTYNDINYYPVGYILSFDEKGNTRHAAILHDLKTNSIINANLSKVDK